MLFRGGGDQQDCYRAQGRLERRETIFRIDMDVFDHKSRPVVELKDLPDGSIDISRLLGLTGDHVYPARFLINRSKLMSVATWGARCKLMNVNTERLAYRSDWWSLRRRHRLLFELCFYTDGTRAP